MLLGERYFEQKESTLEVIFVSFVSPLLTVILSKEYALSRKNQDQCTKEAAGVKHEVPHKVVGLLAQR